MALPQVLLPLADGFNSTWGGTVTVIRKKRNRFLRPEYLALLERRFVALGADTEDAEDSEVDGRAVPGRCFHDTRTQ